MQDFVCVFSCLCVVAEVVEEQQAKVSCSAGDQGVSKAFCPDMLGVLAVD